jgi:hypothetical protein
MSAAPSPAHDISSTSSSLVQHFVGGCARLPRHALGYRNFQIRHGLLSRQPPCSGLPKLKAVAEAASRQVSA